MNRAPRLLTSLGAAALGFSLLAGAPADGAENARAAGQYQIAVPDKAGDQTYGRHPLDDVRYYSIKRTSQMDVCVGISANPRTARGPAHRVRGQVYFSIGRNLYGVLTDTHYRSNRGFWFYGAQGDQIERKLASGRQYYKGNAICLAIPGNKAPSAMPDNSSLGSSRYYVNGRLNTADEASN